MRLKIRNHNLYETIKSLVVTVSKILVKGARAHPFRFKSHLLIDLKKDVLLPSILLTY